MTDYLMVVGVDLVRGDRLEYHEPEKGAILRSWGLSASELDLDCTLEWQVLAGSNQGPRRVGLEV